MAITLEELKDVLDYCPETGVFKWRQTRQGRREIAGGKIPDGYIVISIDYQRYQAHRLAWFYIHGKWPEKHIDHINRNPSDNRICNLREASDKENAQNRSLPKNNTSGYLGVTWNRQAKAWQAQIIVDGKYKNLGLFDSKEMAAERYREVKAELHQFHPEITQANMTVNSLPEPASTLPERPTYTGSPLKYVATQQYKGKTYFNAQIFFQGKLHQLTGFKSTEEAHSAAVEAKQKLHEGVITVEDLKRRNKVTVAGMTMTKKAWAEYLRVDVSVLYKQAKQLGLPFEEVVRRRLPLCLVTPPNSDPETEIPIEPS